MQKIANLGNRIDKLKKKKRKLQQTQAQSLMRELKNLLGNGFSPELAFIILQESWTRATNQQKENWLSTADSFRSPQIQEVHRNDQFHRQPDLQTRSEKNSNE